jgi:hypothetical protein
MNQLQKAKAIERRQAVQYKSIEFFIVGVLPFLEFVIKNAER